VDFSRLGRVSVATELSPAVADTQANCVQGQIGVARRMERDE
jgi:hypothetical protein